MDCLQRYGTRQTRRQLQPALLFTDTGRTILLDDFADRALRTLVLPCYNAELGPALMM